MGQTPRLMQGKPSVGNGAVLSDDHDDGMEQYRAFIVEGEIYQALDLSRRLLQLDGEHAQRADAARLLLDRLRSNHDDSSDHANALLRVLANYATPTKELTEELLSLLFFCEHREQIIHHLSKLTYQSRECVVLVMDAYIELLSSDRSLLVPILGSLADLPLVAADKTLVVDATDSLLDASSEEDVPTVVQSLLSMLVPVAAPRIVKKIRDQCNRLIATTTLSLTFDVIMRHAVAGSCVLTAFLRLIRQNDTSLTPFDVILLALLLARPSENGAAVRVVASLSTKGTLTRLVVRETLQRMCDQKWHEAFPCFIKLASALLTACFNVYRSSSTLTTVQCAVDMLGYLVVYRSAAQEEALSLMMSMVSQPQRLVLSTSRKQFIATAHTLCWDVARAVASQLAHIATAHPTSLSPFAHIFLDHLYGIAASAAHSYNPGETELVYSSYPASILETLCRTMVLLTKHEPGMVSLLMITIQKQLVVPVGGMIGAITTIAHNQASSVVQVKQLMAIFLAGEMLIQSIGERSNRSSLLSWIQKLLASATVSDETTAHVVRLLCSSSIVKMLPPADRDASSSHLSAVCSRHGFDIKKHGVVAARFESPSPQQSGVEFLAGLSEQSTGWIASSLVFDVITYVRVARLSDPPIGWHSLDENDQVKSIAISVERSIRAKIDLLPVLTKALLSTASILSIDGDVQVGRVLVCSFALPVVTEATFTDQSLPNTLWCYACALQIAVFTTNALVMEERAKIVDTQRGAKSMSDTVRQRKRLLNRVQVCWTLHQRLRALLDEASTRLKQASAQEGQSQQQRSSAAWLKLQIDVIEKQVDDKSSCIVANSTSTSLCSLGERLSLQAVSAVFEGLWKQQSSMLESGLEIELFRAFPAPLLIQDTEGDDAATGFASVQALVHTQDGKRTLKYLARRLLDYSELLDSLGEEVDDGSSDAQDSNLHSTRHWVLIGARTLCKALRSVIEVCRKKQLQRMSSVRRDEDIFWEELAVELFAKGASDVRIRRVGSRGSTLTGWSTSCEIIFRSLATATVNSKLGDVACELMDVLLALSSHTRMTSELSQISLALLHSPFPTTHPTGSTPKFVHKLPVLDPTASAALTSLLRPLPRKFHHLVYFIVGAWAIPTLRNGLTHLSYIVECVETLVSSTLPKQSRGSKTRRGRKNGEVDKELDAENDVNGWVARDGEHRVLKNLTHATMPLFLETIIACLTTAPLRAIPLATTELSRADPNPFIHLIGTLAIVSKCLHVFVTAERSGFSLPKRTSLSVLQCGPTILNNVEQALRACVVWREEGSSDKSSAQVSELVHLQCLLEAAEGVVAAVEEVAASFQDRVILTMQQNTQTLVSSKDHEEDGKRGSSGRWSSDLLRKTYRNQFQRRKPLSRREAQALPYFTHAAEQVKAYIAETSATYRFGLDHHRAASALSRSLQTIRLGDGQLEAVLALLAPSDDVRILEADDDLVNKWKRLVSADEDEHTMCDSQEDGFDEVDGEDDSSDEVDTDEMPDVRTTMERIGFKNSSTTPTKRTSASVHTLVPQKKRVKTKQTSQR